MILDKFSMGIGDRFGHQGKAQIKALINIKNEGIDVTPVWNKSHREHTIIGTKPASVRKEADQAIKAMGWKKPYYVDADHIGLKNVDLFIDFSDYFTLDVADFIGKDADLNDVQKFIDKYRNYAGKLTLPDIDEVFEVTEDKIKSIARRYLLAIKEAGKIHRYIESKKGANNFITEVSMDETDTPQTPIEMFFILAALADEVIPIQTIAPKFSGCFNKGVDYVGEISTFERKFEQDLAVISLAIKEFDLPKNPKLSVHSGSDKFSIYSCINNAIKKYNAGLHLKTAGTTWLEELTGLALADGEGLEIAKEIYIKGIERIDELSAPYAEVINIDRERLPSPETVKGWSGKEFALVLRNVISCAKYNLNFRQLLHISYKIAAEMGKRFTNALDKFEDVIAENVTENIHHHLKQIFS